MRNALKQDYADTIRRVAEAGYIGVEPFTSKTIPQLRSRELFDELGLEIPSVHVPMPLGENQAEVLETALTLGCRRIVSGLGPDEFSTRRGIERSCEQFNNAYAFAAAHDLEFGIHNHWWEYMLVEGTYPYKLMHQLLEPEVFFEIDVYWVAVAGCDPLEVLGEVGDRALLLHVKDGPAVKDEPMTALGQGALRLPEIIASTSSVTEWLIVELDECATDTLEAVSDSYRYLVGNGLGRGRL